MFIIQEDLIVNAILYGMFFMHLCKQSSRLEDVSSTSSNMKSAFFWLTLHKVMQCLLL